MSEPLQFTIVYQDGDDGWVVAQVKEVPGAVSQGRTREEARENVIDALRLMLSPEPDGTPVDSEALQLTLAS
jgi:predicted RNase H-like HicB family nuclease